jgi:uncharacterized repeat protein (TIGR02543 family)
MKKLKNGIKKLIICLLIIPIVIFFPACGGSEEDPNLNGNRIPADATYTVHFYTGTVDTFNISPQIVAYKGLVRRPEDPTRVGYIFVGWYKDQLCTQLWSFELDFVTSDTTLYARWQERKYN